MQYSQINSIALAYADRQDTETVDMIDSFLPIVEARVNRFLTTQRMSTSIDIVGDSNTYSYALPVDCLELRAIATYDVSSPASKRPLALLNIEQIDNAIKNSAKGDYYTIEINTIRISPLIDSTKNIKLTYYRRVPPLTPSSTTNWLSDTNPDCYIFGLLTEIGAFVKDAEMSTAYDARFQQALNEIDLQDHNATYSGTPLTTKVG